EPLEVERPRVAAADGRLLRITEELAAPAVLHHRTPVRAEARTKVVRVEVVALGLRGEGNERRGREGRVPEEARLEEIALPASDAVANAGDAADVFHLGPNQPAERGNHRHLHVVPKTQRHREVRLPAPRV